MEQAEVLDHDVEIVQAPLRSIQAIIDDLSQPIEDRFLRTKEARSRKEGTTQALLYVPWFNAVAILDTYAPGWHYEIRSSFQLEMNLVMVVRISIPCLEGIVYRESSALEPIQGTGFGDAATNAESAALRRAASKFGLGLYLYDKDVARNAVRQFQRGAARSAAAGAQSSSPRPVTASASSPATAQRGASQQSPAPDSKIGPTEFWKLQRESGVEKEQAQSYMTMHPNDWPAAYAKLKMAADKLKKSA